MKAIKSLLLATAALALFAINANAFPVSGPTVSPVISSEEEIIFDVAPLTAATTINTPTGTAQNGQTIRFRIVQDATGGRVLTFGSGYILPIGFTFATTANYRYIVTFEYVASDNTWRGRVAGPY